LAPIGYGKSSLLSDWAQTQPRASGSGDNALKVAWLSLDQSENDRTHFLLALIAALRTLHPACGGRAQLFLTPDGHPEPIDPIVRMQIVAGLILIDVQQYLPHPFALVLDNYEQITDPTVLGIMDYLVARLPSQGHVVIASSRVPPIPLVYLQTHGYAARIGTADLAFDPRETALYLQRIVTQRVGYLACDCWGRSLSRFPQRRGQAILRYCALHP
jgi:LuxR family maltose regulon positive regulatory protein